MTTRGPEPDFYPDPDGSGRQRWWDGQAWTARHLKRVPAPKAELKVGGQAKIEATDDDQNGQIGTVDALDDDKSGIEVYMRFAGDPDVYAYRRDEVVAVDGEPAVKTMKAPHVPASGARQTDQASEVPTATGEPPVKPIAHLALPADWYDDPDGSDGERYWDGGRWTKQRRSKANPALEPFEPQSAQPQRWRALSRGVRVGIGIGAAAAVVITVVAIVLGSRSTGQGVPGDGANQPVDLVPPSTPDDWLASVCRAGTFADGHTFPGAVRGGLCVSPQKGVIYIGKYASTFAVQNDLAMGAGSSYATTTDSTGALWVFLAMGSNGDPSAVLPLRQFGFQIDTVPQR